MDITKPRIAHFSPLPPERNGVADATDELLPYLALHADITIFHENPNRIKSQIRNQFPVHASSTYPRMRWNFDMALYHMGNNLKHAQIYDVANRFPGVIVLHDYVLHHFLRHLSWKLRDFSIYNAEMGYNTGLTGIEKALPLWQRKQEDKLCEVPLSKRIIDISLGVIVHSQYTKEKVIADNAGQRVRLIPHLYTSLPTETYREKLGLPGDAVIFASAGQLRPDKQIELSLRAYKRLRQVIPNSYYLLIGENIPEYDISAIVDNLELWDYLKWVHHVPGMQKFMNWINSADVIVNLRYPTTGETSGIALRAMAAGKPVILSDLGWYSEVPEGACVKVPPKNEDDLVEAMLTLAQSAEKRRLVSQSALLYTSSMFGRPELIAKKYIEFILECINGCVGRI